MQNQIIPESKLQALDAEIRTVIKGSVTSYSVNIDDADYGAAFIYYLFFAEHPSRCSILGGELSDVVLFYNKYYWFRRFMALYMRKHGYDASLEDQASDILATCDQFDDVDAAVIGLIHKKANEDLAV